MYSSLLYSSLLSCILYCTRNSVSWLQVVFIINDLSFYLCIFLHMWITLKTSPSSFTNILASTKGYSKRGTSIGFSSHLSVRPLPFEIGRISLTFLRLAILSNSLSCSAWVISFLTTWLVSLISLTFLKFSFKASRHLWTAFLFWTYRVFWWQSSHLSIAPLIQWLCHGLFLNPCTPKLHWNNHQWTPRRYR